MKQYKIEFTTTALDDIERLKKSGDKTAIIKLNRLLHELIEHPRTGTGQVEQLKHTLYPDTWSRRINSKHRLVYEIYDDKIIVKVLTTYGHYQDK